MSRTVGIIVACLIVACLIGTVVAWKLAFPTYTHRYRLTIVVSIDGEVHTGSSVIEVSYIGQPSLGGASPFFPVVRGQATFVDLGQRGAIVAALHPGTIQDGASDANFLAMRAYKISEGFDSYRTISQQVGRQQLASDNMPRLIWFPNVADPKSAQQFADITSLFGPTAQLTGYLEITGDPIVIDIDKKLPWYNQMASSQKPNGVLTRPGEFQLIYNMFVGEGS